MELELNQLKHILLDYTNLRDNPLTAPNMYLAGDMFPCGSAGHPMRHSPSRQTSGSREKKVFRKHSKREESRMKKSRSSPSHLQHLEDSDEEEGGVDADIYHSLSIQVRHLVI